MGRELNPEEQAKMAQVMRETDAAAMRHDLNREAAWAEANGIATYTPAQIRAKRAYLAMTERALARALGVSRVAVQRWESGERTISDANAVRLDELCERVSRLELEAVAAMKRLQPHERLFIIYRDDEHLRAHHPASPLTADTILAIAGRVQESIPCDIAFAP